MPRPRSRVAAAAAEQARSAALIPADFFQRIVESSREAILCVGPDRRLAYANRAATTFFGGRLDGRDLLELVPARAAEGLTAALAQAAEGRRWDGEVECLDDGGAAFPAALTLNGFSGMVAATFQKVSQRKTLETIINRIPGTEVSVFDRNLRMVACSDGMAKLLGFPESLFVGGLPTFEQLSRYNAERGEYGEGDVEELVAAKLAQARRFESHHIQRTRADGTVIEVRGDPLPGGGFVSSFSDITERTEREQALRQAMGQITRQSEVLRAVLDNTPVGISMMGPAPEFRFLAYNEKFLELLGFPRDLFDRDMPRLEELFRFNAHRGDYGEGDVDDLVRARMELAAKREPHCFERVRPDGTVIEVRGAPMAGGGFCTTYTDITERKLAEDRLKQAMEEVEKGREHLRSVIEHLNQGVTVFDRDLVLITWNQVFIDVLDLPEDMMKPGVRYQDMIGHVARRGDYGPGDPEIHVAKRVALARRFEPHRFTRALGSRIVEVRGHPMKGDAGFVTTYTDITDHVKRQEELQRLARTLEDMAYYDPLTGLPNRPLYTEHLTKALERARRDGTRLGVMFLDLDGFKPVNDTYGHDAGDQLLRVVAARLKEAMRASDVVARLGGDEFTMVVPELSSPDMAEAIGRKVLKAINLPVAIQVRGATVEVKVSGSIGISIFPDHALDKDMLVKAADQAMYRAKERGRNRVETASVGGVR